MLWAALCMLKQFPEMLSKDPQSIQLLDLSKSTKGIASYMPSDVHLMNHIFSLRSSLLCRRPAEDRKDDPGPHRYSMTELSSAVKSDALNGIASSSVMLAMPVAGPTGGSTRTFYKRQLPCPPAVAFSSSEGAGPPSSLYNLTPGSVPACRLD